VTWRDVVSVSRAHVVTWSSDYVCHMEAYLEYSASGGHNVRCSSSYLIPHRDWAQACSSPYMVPSGYSNVLRHVLWGTGRHILNHCGWPRLHFHPEQGSVPGALPMATGVEP
jgi:hypothetical protein